MADYYGVQRSDKCLSHYGVKGMKWGVRKALESGNPYKLDRQFRKAQKKLQKLNLKANVDFQKAYAKKHFKRAGIAGGIGLAGIGGIVAANAIDKKAREILASQSIMSEKRRTRKKKIVGEGLGVKKGDALNTGIAEAFQSTYGVDYKHPSFASDAVNYHSEITASNKAPISKTKKLKDISSGIALAGLGTAAYQAGKGLAAKYRTTVKGHAKAVAKRDAWKKEMDAAFKGTRYSRTNKKRMRLQK